MTLLQLTVRDFGLFRGTQTLDLRPVGSERPLVLVGGMNGGGKTTLFDALQLALYGPRARCAKRAGRAYDDFLRDSVHTGRGSAGVAVGFQLTTAGVTRRYEVRREWAAAERVREELTVLCDGRPDPVVTRQWPQTIEELVPLEIAQLFFFDGEKIRALAEDATTAEAVGTAVRALLGLDLVERLTADAGVLHARFAKKSVAPAEAVDVGDLERARDAAQAAWQALYDERATLENDRLRAEAEAAAAEEQFAVGGGRLWEERQARQARLAECDRAAADLKARLVAHAAGELPLALVPDLLGAVARQDKAEKAAADGEAVATLLAARDSRLLAELGRDRDVPPTAVKRLRDRLARDRRQRARTGLADLRLRLTASARDLLHRLVGHQLAALRSEAGDLVARWQQTAAEREELERETAATPSESGIAAVTVALRHAIQRLADVTAQAAALDARLGAAWQVRDAAQAALGDRLAAGVSAALEVEDDARLAALAARTREVMQAFLLRATERGIHRLAGEVTAALQHLLRKGTLVERVHLDPATFAATLYDRDGRRLSRDRLSEGEKQTFAVALLWGLTKASSRPLPAVIDTPMARLDSAHRTHLVERYFPAASHQVVVLSTDTEVDAAYFESLRPHLARAYHLRYDEAERATVVEEGYFWQAAGRRAS